MTSTGWKTGHRGGGCARCAAEFSPGSTVVSCLYEVSDDDDVPFARRDHCAACFDAADVSDAEVPAADASDAARIGATATGGPEPEAGAASVEPASEPSSEPSSELGPQAGMPGEEVGSPFSWWRSEVPQPEDKKAAFDLSVAREFLVRLLGQDDSERASLRYLLTLLLMRKRIVRVVEQFSDERGEIMSVRIPPDETVHEVLCPEIDEAETLLLRDQLGKLFDLGDTEA